MNGQSTSISMSHRPAHGFGQQYLSVPYWPAHNDICLFHTGWPMRSAKDIYPFHTGWPMPSAKDIYLYHTGWPMALANDIYPFHTGQPMRLAKDIYLYHNSRSAETAVPTAAAYVSQRIWVLTMIYQAIN